MHSNEQETVLPPTPADVVIINAPSRFAEPSLSSTVLYRLLQKDIDERFPGKNIKLSLQVLKEDVLGRRVRAHSAVVKVGYWAESDSQNKARVLAENLASTLQRIETSKSTDLIGFRFLRALSIPADKSPDTSLGWSQRIKVVTFTEEERNEAISYMLRVTIPELARVGVLDLSSAETDTLQGAGTEALIGIINNWNPFEYPSLLKYANLVIRSKMIDAYRRQPNIRRMPSHENGSRYVKVTETVDFHNNADLRSSRIIHEVELSTSSKTPGGASGVDDIDSDDFARWLAKDMPLASYLFLLDFSENSLGEIASSISSSPSGKTITDKGVAWWLNEARRDAEISLRVDEGLKRTASLADPRDAYRRLIGSSWAQTYINVRWFDNPWVKQELIRRQDEVKFLASCLKNEQIIAQKVTQIIRNKQELWREMEKVGKELGRELDTTTARRREEERARTTKLSAAGVKARQKKAAEAQRQKKEKPRSAADFAKLRAKERKQGKPAGLDLG